MVSVSPSNTVLIHEVTRIYFSQPRAPDKDKDKDWSPTFQLALLLSPRVKIRIVVGV